MEKAAEDALVENIDLWGYISEQENPVCNNTLMKPQII